MMKDVGKKVDELKVPKADLKPLVEAYQSALTKLPGILKVGWPAVHACSLGICCCVERQKKFYKS